MPFFVFRHVYFKADAFVVLSTAFADTLVNMGFKKKVFLESTAVDDEIFERLKEHRYAVPTKQKSELHILFLARVGRVKGPYIALDTFKLLKAQPPQIKMTIAGDGKELNLVREYAITHGITDVQFPSFLRGERKHNAYASAVIYFLPTFEAEGMPNSVLQAMAYGLPAVTRPIGGLRDFFENWKMGFVMQQKPWTRWPYRSTPLLDQYIQVIPIFAIRENVLPAISS